MGKGYNADVSHDLPSLLSSKQRDFLLSNNRDQIKISKLIGKKTVGLYFSASWCKPCCRFTPNLIEVHKEVSSTGDFEVVFISLDREEESFNAYLSKMPWFALPFGDTDTRDRLKELFKVKGIPCLVILDGDGKFLTDKGVKLITDYGVQGYPFTAERLNFLNEQAEIARKNQTLGSILVSGSRDYMISNDGSKIPVSEVEGRMVGLYFSMSRHSLCIQFTPKLVEVYKKLKERGENFEIVSISADVEEEQFKKGLETMPWLALPFEDKTREKLAGYFELKTVPTLVIIGEDGKTLNANVADFIDDHGIEAYPFTREKLTELAEIDKAKLEAQTLESVLVHGESDFVVDKSGSKVAVSELVGRNIFLYFSAKWCPPCRAFLPKLVEAYHQIRENDETFEVIFISSDREQYSFDEFYSGMPWLALPFDDERKNILLQKFKIKGIPAGVAISPRGKTVTKDAAILLKVHGADAYPFTEQHLLQLEQRLEERAKAWPEKLRHEFHMQHELTRTPRDGYYFCNGCEEMGHGWSFYCKQCDFDLHPKCALNDEDKR